MWHSRRWVVKKLKIKIFKFLNFYTIPAASFKPLLKVCVSILIIISPFPVTCFSMTLVWIRVSTRLCYSCRPVCPAGSPYEERGGPAGATSPAWPRTDPWPCTYTSYNHHLTTYYYNLQTSTKFQNHGKNNFIFYIYITIYKVCKTFYQAAGSIQFTIYNL